MVRETRYLLVGNLPETITENEIAEYFKRYGKIQKVKLERKPDSSSDSDEKEEGCITGLTATVAFTDIKSASNAHKAEKNIGNNVLSSEYSSGFGATGSVVKRTHEPEIFPRVPPPAPFPARTKGFEEEADGFDVYYGTTPTYSEPSYPSPSFAERGRPRERWPAGAPFPGSSKERTKSTLSSMVAKSEAQVSASREVEIEPGEREPLGILIKRLPLRSSDTSLRDGLFHEYKKYGKITAVQVSGVNETRYAIISFKQAEDAQKALEASREKRFFGSQIIAEQHEGLEAEDGDFLTPEAQLDEHSPKATRTLFLGNLDKEISIEELKEKLEKYGDILDVDVKRQGAVTAYAFIQFTDITSVVKALKDLDGTTWGSTKLKVGFGKSMATPVVWLGNLADTVHESFLCKQFARFGALSHTVVDRENHKGLVFFMNVESAQYALPEMRNRIWNGKKIHIDYASRDCQEMFYKKMEQTGQLRPGERPDARSMQKKIAENPHWDDGGFDPNFKRGGFTQFGRGRGRFQRGRGFFRGRGGGPVFEGPYPPDEFAMRRKQFDEYSQGSGQYVEDDYEAALREYGHSQRERHERASQSPPGYDEVYYERTTTQSGHDFDPYDKHRFASYRSLSPGSDREMEIPDEEFTRFKARTPSDERYYYKEKFYDEARSRDRSHSSDSEQRYRLSSEVVRRRSRSRSPTLSKLKRTKELPISYRSHSPPTPTEEEGYYHSDNSPTDFDSAYRKYGDYKKRPSSSSVEGDRKSSILMNTGLRKEIESKTEERSSRKRSYDQLSPKRSDSLHRIERQHSRGSRADSLYEYEREKLSAKELISKVHRLRSEVNERLGVKDSPSSSSNSEIDPATMTEADLIKLHREKQKLLQKLTLIEDSTNLSENESDSRHGSSKKARLDLKYLQKADSLTKQELKEKLKHLDETQSYRKQMDALRKKEHLRDYKKSKSASDVKKDILDYSEEDSYSLNSPRDYPSGFMPKKRRKVEGDIERKGRSYRSRHDEEAAGFSSDDEKDKHELLRQNSAHADLYSSKSRTLSSLDARLESAEFSSHSKEESRRVSSGSDNNKEHSEHSGRSRRHKKRDNHITPLIPLGDDDMPDPETSDPRLPRGKCERPQVLPLPDFAQFIQFSPLPSPCHSPERYSDLPTDSGRDKLRESAVDSGNADAAYQSPCFSPQSSSSKTHSPSQSPSGSGSDTKANTNSDSGSGELPLGFPTDTEQIDPDVNKTDSLDSVQDKTKVPEVSKEHDDSFSDNNSDNDNLTSDNLSIEERIRQLDEKWNKAQAVAAVTPKVIPDVDSMVNNSSTTPSPLLTPYTTAPVVTTAASSPSTSALYSKYRIRKRNDPSGSGTEKSDGPSEIVQTVLSKSSIFDQDSKRLGQTDESVENKDLTSTNENSPKSYSAWNKAEIKENPMVTVPGSLLDRLGQGSNGSFPTLTVNTTFPSATNVSMNKTDSMNSSIYSYDNRAAKQVSPLPSLDIPSVNDKSSLTVSSAVLEDNLLQKIDFSEKSPRLERNGLSGSDLDLTKTEIEKSPVLPKSILKNRSDSDLSLTNNYSDKINLDNNVLSCSSVENKFENVIKENRMELNDKSELIKSEKKDDIDDNHSKLVKSSNLNGESKDIKEEKCDDVTELNKSGAKKEEADSNKDVISQSSVDKHRYESATNDTVKTESKPLTVDKMHSEGINQDLKCERAVKTDIGNVPIVKVKEESVVDSKKSESDTEVKAVKQEVKMEVETSVESKKSDQKAQSSKTPDKEKHSSKESSKSTKDNTFKEPSHKKQKVSKDSKDKKSDSNHKDEKHKKKESDKKGESSHKSSSDKKDDKHKQKSKSEKDKKDSDKKSKEKDEKKDSKEEKKKKVEKKEKKDDKNDKESKDDKSDKHSKEKTHSKDSESKDNKEKSGEKKEKSEKKHEKKDGHKHDKHLKSPDKKSKSAHKEEDGKDKSKEASQKESTPKEGSSKDVEKDKSDKDKPEKKGESSKKEHKSSSHKTKKNKDESSKKTKDEGSESKSVKEEPAETKKNKDDESKKVKDDHSEHKKKDESNNRNNKDSPDKNKDANRKESSERKSSEKVKDKSSNGEKCKEDKSKSKEKENKDKDPDHSKSKSSKPQSSTSTSESSDKPKSQSSEAKVEKPKAENEKEESKKSENKEDKKSKDVEMNKNSFSLKKFTKELDSHKKNPKPEKAIKNKIESKKESKKPAEPECKNKKDTPKKKDKDHPMYNGLTEEDLAIFAQFADESSLSMYAKVKRRSTEKKLHHDKEHEEQKKLISEYKRNQKNNKKHSLSDITESSEVSSDDDNRQKSSSGQKSKKKFAFSSDDSASSTDTGADILQKKNKSKMQMKKPKRILDIYSSDSEEEEMSSKTPSKKSSSGKKKKLEVHRELENKFEFDSISDSDNKTSATKQAKVKTKTKTNKKPSKSTKTESKSQSKSEKKDLKLQKPKIQRKDLSFKDLFSDDSDDSMDSDSDSDIMMTSKSKKKPFFNKNDKNKKKLPRGSSIYTSSEESDSNSEEEFKPMSPPKTTVLPKKTEKKISPFKDHDSDSFNSDIEIKSEKNKKDIKNKLERKHDNSFDSDNSLLSDPELHKVNKFKTEHTDKINNKIDIEIFSSSDAERKFKKQKSKEKAEKDMHKFNNNKKLHDIITDDGRFDGLTKLEMAKVYSETVYEKDTLLSNLTNKDNLPPILADINKEPLYKLGMESVRNDIPNLKDITFDEKSGKIKNKKHKKENKKKKKSKDKPGKELSKEKIDSISNKCFEPKPEIPSQIVDQAEQLKQDSDLENANAVNRNLFDEMKTMKSPEGKKNKTKKEKDASHNISSKQVIEKEKPKVERERLSDSDFLSDSEKRKTNQVDKLSVTNKKLDLKKSPNSDVFDFQEEESKIEPIKESHMKVMKPDLYVASDHEADTAANVPVEIQSVEIEFTSEEQDYKDDGNVCPEVETTEIVIEEATEVKVEKEKPKPRKRKGRKNSGKEDLTEEAVSSLSKESKNQSDIQTEVVPFEAPASNEQELVIDEGVSLHVEDETDKAVESIVNDENDETAKAVESILLDGMPTYAISEPVEPTPELDTNYLQPGFAPGLPAAIPQVGTEVETTTANTPLKGKKGRKGKRTKSGPADTLLNENSNKLPEGKSFDLLGDTAFAPDITNPLDQNDDDDDGRLQIDFDPPKPETKQKKPRKPKQTKGNKMNDAAALAAENKLDNLFGNFNSRGQNKDELNRDSLSSESSELDRSKHEELLFMDREDQRHDSDMMSPDERSTSDDLTSPDVIKAKPKRGRKPKNKDPASVPIPRTNSPRATRTLSPRSPRSNFDPKSPEPKLNCPKNLIVDEGSKSSANVFDFDDDEFGSNKVGQIPSTTAPTVATTTPAPKQRKPRQKKKVEPGLQSPENRSMFSSPEHSDKLIIGSPDPKDVFSPDHKVQYNAFEKKTLFSPTFQPEEQKLEVKTAADDKPPEPLFKAFFEAKPKNEKDPLLVKKGMFSPKEGENKTLTAAQIMSNVDKTIEDVSKGLFESTDDEATSHSNETTPVQKKRQSRKSKEEDIKSPLKSPVPKSPMVKSPIANHINSPPPSLPVPPQQPLVLPGMGIGQPTAPAQIGEPQLAGHVGMFGQMSPPVSLAACRAPGQANSAPEAAKNVEGPQKIPEKMLPHSSPVKTTVLQSPVKSSGITTIAQSTAATSVMSTVSASVAQDLRKGDGAMEGVLKNAMPGFLVPGISASTAMNVVQEMTSAASTAHTTVISSTATSAVATVTPASDLAKRQQQTEKMAQEQQLLEQQRIMEQKLIEQKQVELQKQQEHHVKLKEMELKRQMEQKHIEEQHKKLQEQLKNKELQEMKNKEEAMKQEKEKKRLEEQYKLLQHHQEQLKQLQAVVPGVPPLNQQGMLSPGALSRPRPSLPSPNDGKNGPRPQISAHHAMPPGPFGLQVRPGQFPQHLTPAQIQAMQQHLVQPLGQDKLPTNAELALKHQQLQQHIASQQKAQVQALAEQKAQIAKQQATQAKQSSQQAVQGKQPAHSAPAKTSPATAAAKKGVELHRPPPTSQGPGIPPLHGKEGAPLPGSQEAANQLTQQIKQQLAMQAQHNQGHPGSHGGPPQAPHGLPGWQIPHMRPEGPRQPGPQGPVTGEARTSMPGPVPVLGGNPQQVQRVSPNPPTKSPTVAQTAPNMVLGFSQHQTAAPRAPSPAVAKTAERQGSNGKWAGTAGAPPRPSQPEVRPRVPTTEAGPPATRPEIWGVNGPPGSTPMNMNPIPRPAHQQPPSAHQQQPDTLQLTRPPAPAERGGKDKFIQQQQHIQELQRQELLKHQELQRQQQLRDQALHAQAQKEVQIHKEREEREKREAAQANLASQSQVDPRQSPAVRMTYPFVEPRPPSRDGGKMQQSPAIVDPRDPRFPQQFPGHHPADLRMGSSQSSAFSPAAGNSGDPTHMYSQAELQRLQNGLIPAYPPGLMLREPHLIPGHAPYMLPGHLAYMAQQMEHQQHLVDGRPPSRGTSRPPSNQPVHTVSPTQHTPNDQRNQGRNQNQQGNAPPPSSRDPPHPGDGSLLSLLQRYPVMWQGVLGLKNDQCVVQMHFISGFQPLVKMSLPQQAPDGTVQPLRIAQRMRLEQAQLEGVAKRMQMEKDYCMMLALPCGRDHTDIYQQTRAMSTGFIQYLQQKQAAGIVNVADPGSQQPAYVVHIFPPCDFSQTTLSRLGFDLLYQVKDLAHLIVIIATVA
ncbi:msx2-interacting protein-like isoform X2 [Ruditapes philippinarum]|uniref:msx2-interacting protein-like isoform X2 n=1 Tax=Ruditapes philippinarum TaxID=129788 RepID=UPI00295ADB51|nr:msx2-interacting protein-like isoform X2 [Ruditapes philippinarum]